MRILVLALLIGSAVAACGDAPKSSDAKAAKTADTHDHTPGDGHDHDADEDEHAGHDHGHEEGEPDFAKIDPARAEGLGIQVGKAQGGPIDQSITLTGRLIIDPRRIALVRARFAGPVREIRRDVGEPVKRGETLALVESNESLTVYAVPSPLTGVVLERRTNVGDVTGSEPLFQVGDVTSLQAELQAFGDGKAALRVGAAVRTRIGETEVPGRIVSVAPEIDAVTQARRVRVSLDLPNDVTVAPGQFVTARIASGSPVPAAVAVPTDAVRTLEGRTVVFIPEESGFRARAVKLGRTGLERIEVLEGLDVGEEYVTAGTFLLKAEIGKNLAAHEH